MKYAQIRKYDSANGEGIRTSIFFTGCTHLCPGCFNQEYQDFSYGSEFTEDTQKTLIEYLSYHYVSGLTLLGGEPMDQDMSLLEPALKEIKASLREDQTIWLYSGYTIEELIQDPAKKSSLLHCDVLVDGRFIEGLKNLKLRFRGSENQRILDVKKSLEIGSPVLIERFL